MKKLVAVVIAGITIVANQSFALSLYSNGQKAVCDLVFKASASILRIVEGSIGDNDVIGSENETIIRLKGGKFGTCRWKPGLTRFLDIQLAQLQKLTGIQANITHLCTLDGVYRKGALTIYVEDGKTTTVIYGDGVLNQKIEIVKDEDKLDKMGEMLGIRRKSADFCLEGRIIIDRQQGNNRVVAVYKNGEINITKVELPIAFKGQNEMVRLDDKLSVSVDKLRTYLSEYYNYNVLRGRIKDNPIDFLATLTTYPDTALELAREGFKIVERQSK